MENFLFDLRVALRSLRKSPGFTVIAVSVFALGLGAAVAVFGIVQSVVFRPLGYPDEARLVGVTSLHQSESLEERGDFLPDFWFWRRESRSFDALAFYGWRSMTLDEPGKVQSLQSVAISANLFHLLGIEPLLGRSLEADDETPGRGNVALVSYAFWSRVLGGTEDAVGKSLRIDGRPVTIVGVMPQGTNVPSREADLWLPVGEFGYQNTEFDREERDFRVIGRLREGVSIAAAQGEMTELSDTLASLYPETNGSWRAAVHPLSELVVGRAKAPLLLALGAVAVVFLIACSNIANLFLIRSVRRSREIAMRRALGAGGARLAQQQIAEGLLVTTAGGSAGILVAFWLTRVILFYEPGILPRRDAIALGPETIVFGLVLMLFAAVVFGVLSLGRFHDLPAALKEGTAGWGTAAARTVGAARSSRGSSRSRSPSSWGRES